MEDWKSLLSKEELEELESLTASQILRLLQSRNRQQTGERLHLPLPISSQYGSKKQSEKPSETSPSNEWQEATLVPDNGMTVVSLVDDEDEQTDL